MPDDLDAFLQKAAQKRKKKKQPGIVILDDEAPPAPPPRPATLVQPSSKPLPSSSSTSPPRTPPPRTPPVVTTSSGPREERAALARDVSSHVELHLDTEEFTKRASHLGERVGLADDDMDAHLQQVFDHRVGSLTSDEAEVRKGPEGMSSSEVRAMFQSATDLRRAIILNEILTPPKFDW